LLARLRQAGARVWPFEAGGWPVVVEIYPRLLSGAVAKSRPAARQAYLERLHPDLDPAHRRLAAGSEDAFDAAVSALAMVEQAADLAALPAESDPEALLEGRIWYPGWRPDTVSSEC
jgi:hypothetical protein